MKTVGEVIESIIKCARSEPGDWAQHFAASHEIHDATSLRREIQERYTGENHTRERLRVPRETSVIGGDREDCAVLAICLAENLGLPYEISVKGTALFLYVSGVEILREL